MFLKVSCICDSHCLTCIEENQTCTQCESDYYLQNNSCIPPSLITLNPSESNNCSIKNCLNCLESNECLICKNGFDIYNKKCYSIKCEIYGHCKLCTEFDCVKCVNEYKLEYGFCDEKIIDKKLYLTFLPLTFISLFILLITVICLIRRRNASGAIVSATMVNFRHPSSGNYIIVNPIKEEQSFTNSIIPTTTSTILANISLDSPREKGKCIFCSNNKIFTFTNCGCGLCKEHSNIKISEDFESMICPIHSVRITEKFMIKREQKSILKGNAIEQLADIPLCHVCHNFPGTNSFNCECNVLLCSGCFNENVFMLKFNKCPGCGKQYNPKEINV